MRNTIKYDDDCQITSFDDGTFFVEAKQKSIKLNIENKPKFDSDTGESVIETNGLSADGNKLESWAIASFEPQGQSPEHYHKAGTEIYYVVQGEVFVTIDGVKNLLEEGDCLQINPGQKHKVENCSDVLPAKIIVYCSPAWRLEDYHIISQKNDEEIAGSAPSNSKKFTGKPLKNAITVPEQFDDNNIKARLASDAVLVSHTNENTLNAISMLSLRHIASYLPAHNFLSLRIVNHKVQKNLQPDWLNDVFYRLCQAALTDGNDGQGYKGGNKASVKRWLDFAAAREDKTLLRQLLTMKISNDTREIKEYGAHRPQGSLYGMLIKRGYVALNDNDEGLAEIVGKYYDCLDDGEALRQTEKEKVFPKRDENDTRTLEERVKDAFAAQQPFNFMPVIKAINAASYADLEYQKDNPKNTSTVLGRTIQEFKAAFDEVSRHEAIVNSKHYLQVLVNCAQHIENWSLQDEVFSCQVFGYVQKNMPTHILHAHAQGIFCINERNEEPRGTPMFAYETDGHVIYGPSGKGWSLGENFYASEELVCVGGAAGRVFRMRSRGGQLSTLGGEATEAVYGCSRLFQAIQQGLSDLCSTHSSTNNTLVNS